MGVRISCGVWILRLIVFINCAYHKLTKRCIQFVFNRVILCVHRDNDIKN